MNERHFTEASEWEGRVVAGTVKKDERTGPFVAYVWGDDLTIRRIA